MLCRWLRDGLEVRQEELGKPYKVVKRRGVKEAPGPPTKAADQEEEVQVEQSVIPVPDARVTKMYGRWQTQQWEVPTAVGGIVPKNDRGNVHCPPLASELPKVCALLHLPLCQCLCCFTVAPANPVGVFWHGSNPCGSSISA